MKVIFLYILIHQCGHHLNIEKLMASEIHLNSNVNIFELKLYLFSNFYPLFFSKGFK